VRDLRATTNERTIIASRAALMRGSAAPRLVPSQRVAARAAHAPAAQNLLERGRYRAVQVRAHVTADDRGAVGELSVHQAALVQAPAQAVHVEQAYGHPGDAGAERLGQPRDLAMDRLAQRISQLEAAAWTSIFMTAPVLICRSILRAIKARINENICTPVFEKI